MYQNELFWADFAPDAGSRVRHSGTCRSAHTLGRRRIWSTFCAAVRRSTVPSMCRVSPSRAKWGAQGPETRARARLLRERLKHFSDIAAHLSTLRHQFSRFMAVQQHPITHQTEYVQAQATIIHPGMHHITLRPSGAVYRYQDFQGHCQREGTTACTQQDNSKSYASSRCSQ